MVRIQIEEKIVDEQLLSGKTIEIEYTTAFNQKVITKTFPNDFNSEEQQLFKNIYEKVVYESEIGCNIFRCENTNRVITISGYTRIGNTVDDVENFTNSKVIKLVFTRYGLSQKRVEVELQYGDNFTQQQIDELLAIGIQITGNSNVFEIVNFDSDISVEIVKEYEDSYIDLGGFDEGKIIFKK